MVSSHWSIKKIQHPKSAASDNEEKDDSTGPENLQNKFLIPTELLISSLMSQQLESHLSWFILKLEYYIWDI